METSRLGLGFSNEEKAAQEIAMKTPTCNEEMNSSLTRNLYNVAVFLFGETRGYLKKMAERLR